MPVLGGVRIVALSISSHEQTQQNRVCCRFSVFLKGPFFQIIYRLNDVQWIAKRRLYKYLSVKLCKSLMKPPYISDSLEGKQHAGIPETKSKGQ